MLGLRYAYKCVESKTWSILLLNSSPENFFEKSGIFFKSVKIVKNLNFPMLKKVFFKSHSTLKVELNKVHSFKFLIVDEDEKMSISQPLSQNWKEDNILFQLFKVWEKMGLMFQFWFRCWGMAISCIFPLKIVGRRYSG